jgi:hypothetical protein
VNTIGFDCVPTAVIFPSDIIPELNIFTTMPAQKVGWCFLELPYFYRSNNMGLIFLARINSCNFNRQISIKLVIGVLLALRIACFVKPIFDSAPYAQGLILSLK